MTTSLTVILICSACLITIFAWLFLTKKTSLTKDEEQERNAAIRSWEETCESMQNDEVALEVFRRGLTDGDDLTETEQNRFSLICHSVFSDHQKMFELHKRGIVDIELLRSVEETAEAIIESDFGRTFLVEFSESISGSYRKHIDDLTNMKHVPNET